MTWPDEVYLAGFAIVVVVVTAGAAVVVVVVTIGAAVVVVVAAAAVVVVVVVAGLGVVTVAGFEVVAVVAAALGADDPRADDPLADDPLAGDWLAGVRPELPAAGDVGVAEAAELEGCEAKGVDVVPSGASGAADADLTTRGTPLLGSAAVAGAVGTVSSTRMVVSG